MIIYENINCVVFVCQFLFLELAALKLNIVITKMRQHLVRTAPATENGANCGWTSGRLSKVRHIKQLICYEIENSFVVV